MQRALTAGQMAAVERAAVAGGGLTLATLMERAGEALAAVVADAAPDGEVLVVCGPGNNGGDGWVAARTLLQGGRRVRVWSLRDAAGLPPEAGEAARRAVAAGVEASSGPPERMPPVIVDAVFGFGFEPPARAPYDAVIRRIADSEAFVVAADIPSGVGSDTGAVEGPVVTASVTVAFSALKPGLCMQPGARHAGEVRVADIGVPSALLDVPAALEVPGVDDLRPLLPLPAPSDHKGSRGRVAIVAGSRRYTGAAVLAAHGALRMGSGFVVVVAPPAAAEVVRLALPAALVREVPADADGAIAGDGVAAAVADADAVVAGPGLTTGAGVARAVEGLLAVVPAPLVLDADALNVRVGAFAVAAGRTAPLLLTPHPGEAARLLDVDSAVVQRDRLGAATALAAAGGVCLLKGAGSIVAGAGRTALVRAGSPALARAGTGDVLSGMVGTLLAQGVPPFDAAVLGAHLHGRAGELGAQRLTEVCFTATDVVDFLPDAVREVLGG